MKSVCDYISQVFSFFKSWIKHPKKMGTIMPSTQRLSKMIANNAVIYP